MQALVDCFEMTLRQDDEAEKLKRDNSRGNALFVVADFSHCQLGVQ